MTLFAAAFSVLLAVPTTTLAYRPEIYLDDNGERRVKAVPSSVVNSPKARQLRMDIDHEEDDYYHYNYGKSKGSKGSKKGAKGMKGKGHVGPGSAPPGPTPPGRDCTTLDLLARVEDIVAGEQATAVGETFYFPFYEATTMEVAGVFKDASTNLTDGECVFTGAFSTDYNEETDSFDSQINVAGTCSGTFNTITGGTGAFACATGFEIFTDDQSEEVIASSLYLCDFPCLP